MLIVVGCFYVFFSCLCRTKCYKTPSLVFTTVVLAKTLNIGQRLADENSVSHTK